MVKAWQMVIDPSICNGCYCCQLACKDEHVDNDWSPVAKPQPVTGQFWMKLNEETRGTTPKVRVGYLPVPCQHCRNAPCMDAATGGAIYRQANGLVVIDPAKAVGQKQLVAACPYGAIYWNDKLNIAQKCTGCAHLVDNPPLEGQPYAMPRCADACPTAAISFGEVGDMSGKLANTEVFHPEYGTNPIVRYTQTIQRFITGALLDPLKDECLEGADVTATDLSDGSIFKAKSDNFGDFWVEPLAPSRLFSVKIEMPGYFTKTFGVVSTAKDANLGDIPLYKK